MYAHRNWHLEFFSVKDSNVKLKHYFFVERKTPNNRAGKGLMSGLNHEITLQSYHFLSFICAHR